MQRFPLTVGLVLLISIIVAPDVRAQTELELATQSLEGIGPIAVSVQLEGSADISSEPDLDVRSLAKEVRHRLDSVLIPVLAAEDDTPESPRLWIHVNAMEAGRGIVPFNIEVQVQQEASLVRNDFEALMVTWETSIVGVVSMDRLVVIREALLGLLDEFIDDYHRTNGDADRRLPSTIR
jgi:hypothetical protein